MSTDAAETVAAVWRAESARVVAGLARYTGDLDLAEDLAQDALAAALEQWPRDGVPESPGAWLTAVAKRRAIDGWRRAGRFAERMPDLAGPIESPAGDPAEADAIDDDVLRLVFTACHPVLGREARVALTLRVVAGLTSEEIARAFLLPVGTVQQRIVRAKRTLSAARVPFEVPDRAEFGERLDAVLDVVYLVFSEGYAATAGEQWFRADLAREALRLGRLLADLLPREPEVAALVALMAFQSSRFDARTSADGTAVLLDDQDRTLWDRTLIAEGSAALARADALASARRVARGPLALQAAIAAVHALAAAPGGTDWTAITVLYDALLQLRPSPVIALNRAVAESRAVGPATALAAVDQLGELDGFAPYWAVRGDLLARLERPTEAVDAFRRAAGLTRNEAERTALLGRADAVATDFSTDLSTGSSTGSLPAVSPVVSTEKTTGVVGNSATVVGSQPLSTRLSPELSPPGTAFPTPLSTDLSTDGEQP